MAVGLPWEFRGSQAVFWGGLWVVFAAVLVVFAAVLVVFAAVLAVFASWLLSYKVRSGTCHFRPFCFGFKLKLFRKDVFG